MKKLLLIFSFLTVFLSGYSQIPNVTIQEIQGWPGQFQPDSCTDGPNPLYLNQVVKIKAVVITPGGLNETTGQTRWIWVRDVTASPSTPFGNITVRASAATTPTDINTLVSGDTIEVVGTVTEFLGSNGANNGETQLTPVDGGVELLSFSPGPAPEALPVSVGQLNGNLNSDGQPLNHILTGEPLEGNFVEISNVTVVNVTLTGDRCRILVKDANDNHIWIYDRFRTQRTTNGFVAPNVGDQYTKVKGVIEGWKNGCGNTSPNNRGYNINPFSLTHYTKGASSPSIGNMKKSQPCPNSLNPLIVSADITDDSLVTSAEVLYSIDGTTYTAVAAQPAGTRYSAAIPPQQVGTLVRYYFRAKDNVNNTTVLPNVPGQSTPLFYTVSNIGCTIRDIQYTPYAIGRSGYVGDTVTLRGIVTASAENNNLGFVYIQQDGDVAWSGIWVNGGSLITNLVVGDRVAVTGVVEEYFGLTRLSNISNVQVIQTQQPVPSPVTLNPNIFSVYDFATCEKYESMLVSLVNPVGNLFVVDTNADAAQSRNNGEWRVGNDVNDPSSGCRVLTGRQGSSTFSSLNVSYVNSPIWATTDGTMNVPVIIVSPGQEFTKIQGILTYSFSNMKLLPRNNLDLMDSTTNTNDPIFTELKVYPNPVNDLLNIRNITGQKLYFEILNVNGKKIKNGELQQIDNNVNLRILTGVYYLLIKDSYGIIRDRYRVVKQ
jgi:DNA/RNA endonuclease YhcR with UshA esterase domain